jgi:hypothetical protein
MLNPPIAPSLVAKVAVLQKNEDRGTKLKIPEPTNTRVGHLDRNARRYKNLEDPGGPLDRKNAVLLLVCNNVPNELI